MAGRRAAPGWAGMAEARPLIALAEATPLGERLSGILDQAKWEARTMLRVQTYALAGALVGKGLGCAFLDAYTAAGLSPAGGAGAAARAAHRLFAGHDLERQRCPFAAGTALHAVPACRGQIEFAGAGVAPAA